MLSLICPVCGLEIPPHTKIVFVKLREDGSPILFELGVACDHVPVPDGAIPFGSLGCAKDWLVEYLEELPKRSKTVCH
jgi:hypothetical protein